MEFSGNASLPDEELRGTLVGWLGRDLSVAQMSQMADAVTEHYRKRGFMVATAYVAAQRLTQRTLRITVIEGRFSEITVRGNTSWVPDAMIHRQLSASLCGRAEGCRGAGPVRRRAVERAGLLVSEIPGVQATYELAPGVEPGSTSLLADVTAAPRLKGTASVDNGGLAFTGRARAALAVSGSSLLGRGDQISLNGAYSGKGFVSFALDASAPAGSFGTRIGATAGHLRYALGREFSVLDATGVSDSAGLYATHPLVRTFTDTTDLRADIVAKRIGNDIGILDLHAKIDAVEGIATLSGARLDNWLNTASTQYRLVLTGGQLRLRDAPSRAFDNATARTAGAFGKVGYALRREEALAAGWTAFASLSGQYALTNLDSSEKFALSGPAGVRSYDTGAVAADTATLVTIESRWTLPPGWSFGHQIVLAPFYDHGWSTFNQRDWAGYNGPRNGQLAGAGAYISVVRPGRYVLKAVYAARVATSEDVIAGPRERVWVEAAAAF